MAPLGPFFVLKPLPSLIFFEVHFVFKIIPECPSQGNIYGL